jgi:hypothetical protein
VPIAEEHLATCNGCKEELASLRSVVGELRSLESVRAPDDFLDKLHERIEARPKLVEFIRKLFVPMHIKIPLEFAGAAAVAVLVFFIVRPHLPEERLVTTAGVRSDIESAKRAPAGSEMLSKKDEAYKSKLGYKGKSKEVIPVPAATVAKRTPASRVKTELMDLEHEPKISSTGLVETKTIELALLLERKPSKSLIPLATATREAEEAPTKRMRAPKAKSRPTKPLVSEQPTVGGVGQKAKLTADDLEHDEPAKADPGEARAKGETESDLSPFRWDEASSKVKEQIRLAEGMVISVDDFGTTGKVEFITAEIPAQNYESFYEKLGQVASLQGPPPSISKQDETPVRIRIRFIPSE